MTAQFQEGDLVKVVHQPVGLSTQIVGMRGFIEEADGDRMCFHALMDGPGHGGSGFVPADCLKSDDGPELAYAFDLHKKGLERRMADAEKARKRYDDFIASLAAKHGVAEDVVLSIILENDEFKSNLYE